MSGCGQFLRSGIDDEKDPHVMEGKRRVGGMDYDGAIQSFERALQSNPRNATAHRELGILHYTKKNDYAAAIYHYQRHLALQTNSPMADLVKQHILFSKRELARTDSYPALSRDVQRDLERYILTNNALKQRIAVLEAELTRGPGYITNYVTNFVKVPQFDPRSGNTLTKPAQIVEAPVEGETDEAVTAPESSGSPPRSIAAEPVQRPATERPAQRSSNIRSSSTPSTRTPAAAAATRRTVHTVRPGETLQVLARRYGIPAKDIRAANPGLGNGVRAGQKVNIPSK